MDKPPQLLGGTAIKPPERTLGESIRYFLYDPEKGEFFTRTPKSWLLIIIFYCIYYTLLACFWYGMLQLFFITLPLDKPKYMLEESIIGKNPGVGLRPAQPDVTIDSSMLKLVKDAQGQEPSGDFETASNIDWAERYRLFLNKYDNKTNTRVCDDSAAGEEGEQACQFDVSQLGSCAEFPYGYELASGEEVISPCALLKINRIFGWMPEPYTEDDLENDEEDPIPDNVKALIRANANNIYLDCTGENPFDRELLEGKVKYFPSNQAISYKYFPYNQAHDNYHNPVVAVKFEGLTPGVLHHIECKLWSKGVLHSSKHRAGQVHFELIID